MKLILDTHIMIWAFFCDDLLPKKFADMIVSHDSEIYCSTVSLWEAALKHSRHPGAFPFTPDMLWDLCDDSGFGVLQLRPSHIVELDTLRRPDEAAPHNDPFDRILLAQAKAEGYTLLTHDEKFTDWSENCVIVE